MRLYCFSLDSNTYLDDTGKNILSSSVFEAAGGTTYRIGIGIYGEEALGGVGSFNVSCVEGVAARDDFETIYGDNPDCGTGNFHLNLTFNIHLISCSSSVQV